MHGRRSRKSSSFPQITGAQWSSTVESTLWGMAPGVAVVLGFAEIALASWQLQRVAVPVESTVPRVRRGGAPRVLQAGVLPWSRSGPLPRAVPMPPFKGSAEGKARRWYGELVAQWLE